MDNLTDKSIMDAICNKCKSKSRIKYKSYKNNVRRNDGVYMCFNCATHSKECRDKISKKSKEMWSKNKDKLLVVNKRMTQSDSFRQKVSKNMKEKWADDQYRSEMLSKYDDKRLNSMSKSAKEQWEREGYREKARDASINLWKNPEFRKKNAESRATKVDDESYRKNMSKAIKKCWEDEEYRDKISQSLSDRFKNDDNYRQKMIMVLNRARKIFLDKCKNDSEFAHMLAQKRAQQPKISNLQLLLYSILDDLEIPYYREDDEIHCVFGPYVFDCVIPRGDRRILIECQGNYWHSLDGRPGRDLAKNTYINKYHPDCEIKYLWEHEFKCKDKVIELLKYWLGITGMELIDFSLDDINIKRSKASEYRLLLSKYHYLLDAGKGGLAYGAYLGDELIAVCVFSPLIRQNLPWDKKTTRELSRLCIHPRYQKKNFASWFVSRCIKNLDPKFDTIISYCDTTFNHDGVVYKACNFELDGEVRPDYWYVDDRGWVMHKKTLYNHAVKMGMREREYAELNDYHKVFGEKKLRFIYKR